MAERQLPSPEVLRQLLRYEPGSGKLFWKERLLADFPSAREAKRWNTRYSGTQAFTSRDGNGYYSGSVFGQSHRLHRVAWAIHHGIHADGEVDHINMDRSDNRILNLRCASHSHNQWNRRAYASNTSGHKGVSWHKATQKWLAKIKVNGSDRHLGVFASVIDAADAYDRAAAEMHGCFARPNQ